MQSNKLNLDDLFVEIDAVSKEVEQNIESDLITDKEKEKLDKKNNIPLNPLSKEKEKGYTFNPQTWYLEKDLYYIFEKNKEDKMEVYESYFNFQKFLIKNSFVKFGYKMFFSGSMIKNILIMILSMILFTFNDLHYLLKNLALGVSFLMFFLILLSLILRHKVFNGHLTINWISYMRYVLREKYNFNNEEVDDETYLLIYENKGISSTFNHNLLDYKYVEKQENLIKQMILKKHLKVS